MTCLCLTRNRRNWLTQAIQCYRLQTYANRELLIIADGEDVQDLVPEDDSIRLFQVEEGFRIGDKRNFGASQALGSCVAHWDDDDYSAPGRLADQVERIQSSGLAVTGYHSMRFTDGEKWWRYRGPAGYSLGTALCYRRDWWEAHRFEAIHVGEDNSFVTEACRYQQLISVDAGDLMYATIHAGNTSPKTTTGSHWEAL